MGIQISDTREMVLQPPRNKREVERNFSKFNISMLDTVPVDCDVNEVTGPISGKSWVLMAWM